MLKAQRFTLYNYLFNILNIYHIIMLKRNVYTIFQCNHLNSNYKHEPSSSHCTILLLIFSFYNMYRFLEDVKYIRKEYVILFQNGIRGDVCFFVDIYSSNKCKTQTGLYPWDQFKDEHFFRAGFTSV